MSQPLSVTLVGLVAAGSSGVGRYAAALTHGLDRVQREFPQLRLTLLTNPRGADAVRVERIAVQVIGFGGRRAEQGPLRLALEHVLARRARADLLHFFDTTGPVLAPSKPFVTTAHDATIAYGFNPRRGGYKLRLYPWALKRARAIVAVSAFAGDEVARHFGADPAKIRVIHSGPGLTPPSDVEPPQDTDGTGTPFLLYVGNLAANKNLPFLVRAFAASGIPGRLVLAGRPGEGFEDLRDELDGSPRCADIELRTSASDAEIEALYRSATALVLPSRYEGFGFTPLEAMARGCPVVASDIPAVREVSGDGALLVPLEEDAWVDALRRVAVEDLSDLRARGAATVARYSWDETARRLCALFAEQA